jgi:GDP-4-dehydro-6-deoxy-D-mannose reductase
MRAIDLMDRSAVDDLIRTVRPDAVCHLAAQSSVNASWQDPLRTLAANAGMQLHVLEAVCAYASGARVLIVGSCDEYGDVPVHQNPIVESQPLEPLSPYGLSKVTQDLMGLQYARTRELDVVRVRPFLQLGPRRTADFATGSFAKQVAEIAAGRQAPHIVVGSIDLQKDFLDVRDVADAYLRVVESGRTGAVYNIATGVPHTLRELLRIMLHEAGVDAAISVAPHLIRPRDPALIVGNASLLRKETGWQPAVSFNQSVIDTLRHWQQFVATQPPL